MSELVDRLAELTGFRDRDVLDVTLVGAINDLIRPSSVAIYRSVGEPGQERWLTRARLSGQQAVASTDDAFADPQGLPRLAEFAARHEAFMSQRVVHLAGPPHVSLFPVVTDRDVIGVLEIESTAALDSQAQRLVGSILRIYRNFQSLLDYSERDTLTGLLNRKTFDETFLKVASQLRSVTDASDGAERRSVDGPGGSGSIWLGMIDIDHFKRVNDNHGHLIGDEVLLLLSRLMRSSFRFHDRLYRFGGEEFVVLMRCHGEADALLALERLRANAEKYAFPQVGQMTVSIGFTEVNAGDSPNAAFERADQAVYFAKGAGRNRVCSHADLVARGQLKGRARTGDVELF